VAKALGEGLGRHHLGGIGQGKLSYMSPEQNSPAAGVDHRTDLFAVGVTLHEALTGRRVVQG